MSSLEEDFANLLGRYDGDISKLELAQAMARLFEVGESDSLALAVERRLSRQLTRDEARKVATLERCLGASGQAG